MSLTDLEFSQDREADFITFLLSPKEYKVTWGGPQFYVLLKGQQFWTTHATPGWFQLWVFYFYKAKLKKKILQSLFGITLKKNHEIQF